MSHLAPPTALPQYELRSDLAQYCLPSANRDETRKLAWTNSVCLMFLAVAAITLRQPVFIIREAEPLPEPMPVVILPPQADQDKPKDEPKEEEEPQEDLPDILTQVPVITPVAVARPEDVAFAVTVQGFTAVSSDVANIPPPPAVIPKAPPPDVPPPPIWKNIRMGGREFRRQPPPPYDEFARARISGTIEALITVGTNGIPSKVEVGKSSGSPALDRHVTEFIRREWRAEAGQDVARYRIAITFIP